jgi:hypothetical protein
MMRMFDLFSGKRHSFVGYFNFIGIDECIQIIFIGPETNEYKLIFIGLGQTPTNIWVVQFEFYWTHIFISGAMSPMNIRVLYSSVT